MTPSHGSRAVLPKTIWILGIARRVTGPTKVARARSCRFLVVCSEEGYLKELAADFSDIKFDWACVKDLGLVKRCMAPGGKRPCSGKVLSHTKDQIHLFRKSMGTEVCCFKIGITSNPLNRFAAYVAKAYTEMWLIHECSCVGSIQMLEAALISEFGGHIGCQNKPGTGGEGALNKENAPPPPYFVYVTGGRADQHCRVG